MGKLVPIIAVATQANAHAAAARAERDSVFLQAAIRAVDGTISDLFKVRNISSSGLLAEGPILFEVGRELLVELRNIGTVRACVVRSEPGRLGLRFETPVDPKAVRLPIGKRG